MRFVEDDKPNDLAVVEGDHHPPSINALENLAPDLKPPAQETAPPPVRKQPAASSSKSAPPRPPALSPPSDDSDSDFEPESRFVPDEAPAVPAPAEPSAEPAAPRQRGSRWANLPPREHLQRDHRPPQRGYPVPETAARSGESALVVFSGELTSYCEAVRSPASKQWELAIAAEYEQLRATKTFEWVRSPPDRRKAVGSRIIFCKKKDTFGKTVKYKAQFVAQGFSQVPGRDYNPLSMSSTVFRTTTLRALLAIVA